MASPVKEIVTAQFLPASSVSFYQSPSGVTTRIDKITFVNTDDAVRTVTVHLVPSGGSSGDSNLTTITRVINPKDMWNSPNEYGHYLNPGDALFAHASVADKVVILVGGTQVS